MSEWAKTYKSERANKSAEKMMHEIDMRVHVLVEQKHQSVVVEEIPD